MKTENCINFVFISLECIFSGKIAAYLSEAKRYERDEVMVLNCKFSCTEQFASHWSNWTLDHKILNKYFSSISTGPLAISSRLPHIINYYAIKTMQIKSLAAPKFNNNNNIMYKARSSIFQDRSGFSELFSHFYF